jgi:Flp pilus assembly protein TadB
VQEVIENRSLAARVAALVGFWTLALAGVGLFALAVWAPALAERQDMRQRAALEQAKADQLKDFSEQWTITRDALKDEPKFIARQVREDMGYQHEGDETLPFAVRAGGPHLNPLAVHPIAQTRLEKVCHLFAASGVRWTALMASVMLLAVAVIAFEIPTEQRRKPVAA